MTQIDALIQAQPNNPYFYELKGQALTEGGQARGRRRAAAQGRGAVHNAPLIEILLGQALVATDNKAYTEEAINLLRNAMARETEQPQGYTELAMAFARKGDLAEADLASAQAAFLRGRQQGPRVISPRAPRTRFAIGTPGWVKADDIVSAKLPAGQRKTAPNSSSRRDLRIDQLVAC